MNGKEATENYPPEEPIKWKTEVSINWELDRMLHEDYERGVFSPRKRVKLGRTQLVILKLDPPNKGWDYP